VGLHDFARLRLERPARTFLGENAAIVAVVSPRAQSKLGTRRQQEKKHEGCKCALQAHLPALLEENVSAAEAAACEISRFCSARKRVPAALPLLDERAHDNNIIELPVTVP
jgi:hypothetical protein